MLPLAETAKQTTRRQRLVARITDEQKRLFQRAADVQGRNLSDFIVTSVQEAATRAIQDHTAIQLDLAASESFVAEMLKPSPLPERLQDTIRRYHERTSENGPEN
jgi:uncharacterized protein (DUF1778 family)